VANRASAPQNQGLVTGASPPFRQELFSLPHKARWEFNKSSSERQWNFPEKWRVGSRWGRRYDRPQTAYQRLLARGQLARAQTARLREYYASLGPFQLAASFFLGGQDRPSSETKEILAKLDLLQTKLEALVPERKTLVG
jgi:hypothetical protein